jgi:hypothetical protein
MTDTKTISHDEHLRNEIRLKARNDDGAELTEAQIHMCIMMMEKMQVSYFHGHMWPNRRKRDGVEVLTWALTADGHRAVARRHGLAGIDEPIWEVDEAGGLICARVTVYRRNHVSDGPSRFEQYAGVAYYDEFVERKYSGEPNYQWSRRPRNQLAKCAEMQALSRGFPETGTETVGHASDHWPPEEAAFVDVTPADGDEREADPEPEHQETAPEHDSGPAPKYETLPQLREETIPLLKAYCDKFNGSVAMSWRAAYDALCEPALGSEQKMAEEHYLNLKAALQQALTVVVEGDAPAA